MGWGISGGTVLPQWQIFLRAFGACEYHLLEHYLRGKISPRLRRMRVSPSGALPQGQFFPAPSAQASITTTNVAQKVANIRVGDHSHIHSRQRCHEEFLPTGLLRPGGDYHLVIAGKGYYHPVNPIYLETK